MFAKPAWKLGSRPQLRRAGYRQRRRLQLSISELRKTRHRRDLAYCVLQTAIRIPTKNAVYDLQHKAFKHTAAACCLAEATKMASLGEDLLGVVNKLQDLVFNTIGNDSLDLPQIVRLMFLPQSKKRNLLTLL